MTRFLGTEGRRPGQGRCALSCSQNQGTFLCHDDRVFELRNQAPISGSKGPSIRIIYDMVR
jgi:hypothetical protein